MKNSLQNHTSAISFLGLIGQHLPQAVVSGISQNKLALDPFDLYIAADVSGAAGEVTILDVQTDKLVGVSSFDSQGRLNGNKVAIFDTIKVLSVKTAQAGDDVRGLKFSTVLDLGLHNVEIVAYQRNQEVFRSALQEVNGKASTTDTEDVSRELGSPRFFVPGEDITIKIEVPKTVQLPVGTYIKLIIPALTTRNV